MPLIEYSPSGRAKCQGCYSVIPNGCVRVGVKHNVGGYGGRHNQFQFQMQYYHAKCYTNLKDFSRFQGWHKLKKEDKVKFGLPPNSITKIANLTTYTSSSRWKIQALVVSKTEIRHWNNPRTGAGKLFSVELIDESGVDIKATFFKDAVDKFYELLNPNETYTFVDGTIKSANAQYNTCKSSYELTFDVNSDIQACTKNKSLKNLAVSYDFCANIAALESMTTPSTVDVAAMVLQVDEVTSFIPENSSTQEEKHKRHLVLVDDSGCKISWTLWGESAAANAPEMASLVVLRHARLTDYRGRSLSGASSWKPVEIRDETSLEQHQPRVRELWQWKNKIGSEALESAMMNARSLTEEEETHEETTAAADVSSTTKTNASPNNSATSTAVTPAATKRKLDDVQVVTEDPKNNEKEHKRMATTTPKTNETDFAPQAAD